MSELKRYEIGGPDWEMDLSPIGEWVCYDDYAALEAECAKLRPLAEDRDQQYDMKVKARAQRDAALAECERLREALQKISETPFNWRESSARQMGEIAVTAMSTKSNDGGLNE